MKIIDRILTIGLGLALFAASGTAFADHELERKVSYAPWDRNYDGEVTLAEYQQYELDQVMAAFDRADCNDNGVVSIHEARESGVDDFVRWADAQPRYPRYRVYRSYYPLRHRAAFLTRSEVRARSLEASKRAFLAADLDRSGVICDREVTRFEDARADTRIEARLPLQLNRSLVSVRRYW